MIKRWLLAILLLLFLICVIFVPNILNGKPSSYEKKGLIVTAVAPNNKNLKHDEFMDFGDYITIYNNLSEPINLKDYTITDDFRSPDKWVFPSYEIKPNEEIYVFFDGKDLSSIYLHTNFSLNNEGEEILFRDNNDNVIFKWTYDFIEEDDTYVYSNNGYKIVKKQYGKQLKAMCGASSNI